jgi:hypothetical protein
MCANLESINADRKGCKVSVIRYGNERRSMAEFS